MTKTAIRLSIAVLIGALALYLAFRGVDLEALMAEFRRTNLWLILAGTGLLFVSHAFRAWRWQVIVRPMKARTSLWAAWKAIMAAYAMNNVIPRSGDLVRPYLFAKRESLFLSGTIASVLVEKVVDLLSTILFILLALVLFPVELERGFPSLKGSMLWVGAVTVLALVLVLIMVFSADKTVATIFRLTRKWPAKFRDPIDRAATEFGSGLKGVRAGGAGAVLLGTLGVWAFYVLSMFAWLYAFPEAAFVSVGLVGAFFLRVVSGMAFLLPAPGGVGSYHYFISQALFRIFLVPLPSAIAYATLTHAAMYILTTVVGLTIVLAEGINLKDFGKVVKASEHNSPAELAKAVHEPSLSTLGVQPPQ
jgi:uncharacterized protein (TIRG00374 family)